MDISYIISTHRLSWDEASRQAEERLKKEGIQIPWQYSDAFGDNFKVLALRAGGFGAVFFVKSTHFGERIYAAKTLQQFLKEDYLKLHPSKQEEIAKDFLEEALPWLEMGQHPNIVSVHLLENIIHPKTRRNVPFVFSEFMERGDLRCLVIEKGSLSLEETLSAGLQICEGLLHAYKHGISAHKDLKPENIMVYKDGIYKVTDFSARVKGTPGYMAPEQVAGAKVDHRADQFAVGLIMHDVFKGGDTQNQQIKRVMYNRSDPQREVLSDNIPSSLKGIIARCLQPKIEDRFNDISELKKELLKTYKSEFKKEYCFPEVEINDSPEWWFNRGRALQNIGRYASAEIPYKKALGMLTVISGTEFFQWGCLMNLGNVYENLGRFFDAEEYLKEALRMLKTISGTEKHQARCLKSLGVVYMDLGKFSEAAGNLKEALRILKTIPGTEIIQARCLGEVGNIYFHTGKFFEAEGNYKEALRIYKAISGTEIRQAYSIRNLGVVYLSIGKFSEAADKLKEALRIYKAISGTEIEQARCVMNLGVVYESTDKFFEAEGNYKEALRMYKAILGAEMHQAQCHANLGNVYRRMNKFFEAEYNLKEALRMYKAIPGADIDQAKCLTNTGIFYARIQEFGKARSVLKEALEICKRYPKGTEQIKNACFKILSQIT
jgi:tetratricopeptide (TPR) repeat protein